MTKSARPGDVCPRILIVDDDVADVEAVSGLLRQDGFEVDAVSSTEEALGRFRSETYGVVVCDLQLPGESGLNLYAAADMADGAKKIVELAGGAP